MNLTALTTAVRRRTGLPSTDPFAADTDVQELIVEAIDAFSSSRFWPWLEESVTLSITAGTREYAMPTGWIATKQVQIDGDVPMDGRNSRAALDVMFPDSAERGRPEFWCISEDALRFYPVPDAAYTASHLYFQAEPTLSFGTSVPLAPTWTHAAIADKAASLLLARTNRHDRAAYFEGQYAQWFKGVIDNDRRATVLPRIRIRSGSQI